MGGMLPIPGESNPPSQCTAGTPIWGDFRLEERGIPRDDETSAHNFIIGNICDDIWMTSNVFNCKTIFNDAIKWEKNLLIGDESAADEVSRWPIHIPSN